MIYAIEDLHGFVESNLQIPKWPAGAPGLEAH
jgi:hypothetical protein